MNLGRTASASPGEPGRQGGALRLGALAQRRARAGQGRALDRQGAGEAGGASVASGAMRGAPGTPLGVTLLVLVTLARRAPADDAAADRAFQAAMQSAVAGDPGAIDAFEASGATRPVTRWTDDAWIEAARLAERVGDYVRARRAYEQVLATTTEQRQIVRAQAALGRLAAITGGGQWDAVTREHERLVSEVFGGDDPHDELVQLEALVTRHPGYPRVNAIRLALGRGWEEEGQRALSLGWLRRAAAAEPRERVTLVRALIRAGELNEAERELARCAASDPTAVVLAREALATAMRRAWIARVLWALLALGAVAAGVLLRGAAGSWRAAGSRLARPPGEAVFLIPIAAVLSVIARTGNPLVGRAVTWIAIAGVVVTWVSGAILDTPRARGRLRLGHLGVHVIAVVLAVGAAGYLAVLQSGALDLVLETWRAGHAER